MTKEEYLAKHITINDYIKKKNPNDNEYNDLSNEFEKFDTEQKVFISREILKEIIILFKSRGMSANVFKKVIDNFMTDLWLYEIFGDKMFYQKNTIDPPLERI